MGKWKSRYPPVLLLSQHLSLVSLTGDRGRGVPTVERLDEELFRLIYVLSISHGRWSVVKESEDLTETVVVFTE